MAASQEGIKGAYVLIFGVEKFAGGICEHYCMVQGHTVSHMENKERMSQSVDHL